MTDDESSKGRFFGKCLTGARALTEHQHLSHLYFHVNMAMKGTPKQVQSKYGHQIITQNYAKFPKLPFSNISNMVLMCNFHLFF